ncbi:MAG: SAM-dependent DNA methyltransferase [Anaerolineales bacterium]|nr:SAM-dependent DNA methyltransferase [Anaerolineales bacterium]
MPRGKRSATPKTNGSANLDFEEKLWLTADKLRGHMDASEYKHVVLGLIFLKYISDAFEERHTWLLKAAGDPKTEYYVKDEKARYRTAG